MIVKEALCVPCMYLYFCLLVTARDKGTLGAFRYDCPSTADSWSGRWFGRWSTKPEQACLVDTHTGRGRTYAINAYNNSPNHYPNIYKRLINFCSRRAIFERHPKTPCVPHNGMRQDQPSSL